MLIAKSTSLDNEIFWMISFIRHYKLNDEKSSKYFILIKDILSEVNALCNDNLSIMKADRSSLEIKLHLLTNAKELFVGKTEVNDELINGVYNFLKIRF